MNIFAIVNAAAGCTISVVRQWILATLVFAFVGTSVHAMAATTGSQPEIKVEVSSSLGYPVFNASANTLPYSFGATIKFPVGGPLLEGDLYFGIIQPGGGTITFTWVVDGEVPSLKKGMTPISRGIDMRGNSVFNLSAILGRDIEYVLTGDEPHGMYLIFALLVVADTNPANTQNWAGVEMIPLFIN